MQLISVIIPTCNRNELLRKCLDALKPGVQTIGGTNYEVIVTDDSKESIAAEFIQKNYAWAKWVKGPGKGPAANRNNGAKNAKGDWLVFVDDDCLPDVNFILAYYESISAYKNVHVFEGYIGVDRKQKSFSEESPINTTGGYLWSCNFMIEKDLFINTLKGFDEEYLFAAMEDVDLYYRLKKLNERVHFLSMARVIHPWRIQKKPFRIGKKRFSSLLYFLKKFPEKKKDYNAAYFLKAFLFAAIGIIKNSIRFRFRGFSKRLIFTLLQLYFAMRISIENNK